MELTVNRSGDDKGRRGKVSLQGSRLQRRQLHDRGNKPPPPYEVVRSWICWRKHRSLSDKAGMNEPADPEARNVKLIN